MLLLHRTSAPAPGTGTGTTSARSSRGSTQHAAQRAAATAAACARGQRRQLATTAYADCAAVCVGQLAFCTLVHLECGGRDCWRLRARGPTRTLLGELGAGRVERGGVRERTAAGARRREGRGRWAAAL